jgi:hypothetical protein
MIAGCWLLWMAARRGWQWLPTLRGNVETCEQRRDSQRCHAGDKKSGSSTVSKITNNTCILFLFPVTLILIYLNMGEIFTLPSSFKSIEPQKYDYAPQTAGVLGILAYSYSRCWLSRLP